MSEHLRTETDDALWTRGGGLISEEQPGDNVEFWPRLAAGVPGRRYAYFARLRRIDGVPVVDALVITGPDINAAVLRALSIRPLVALAYNASDADWRARPAIGKAFAKLLDSWPGPPIVERASRVPLTRPDGTDPEGFSRRVAQAYNEALSTASAPAKALAAEAGVPVTTVHRWVRDARRLGLLPPARKGRAG